VNVSRPVTHISPSRPGVEEPTVAMGRPLVSWKYCGHACMKRSTMIRKPETIVTITEIRMFWPRS